MTPLPPLPYQDIGARFLAAKDRAGLFDRPGLGKTAQAIIAADRIRARRIMIVCPASAVSVWVGEFKKFALFQRRIVVAKTIHDLGAWLRGKGDVLILSYDRATNWKKHLEDLVDLIIFDEAHYLKNKGSQRTTAALGHECDGAHGYARWGRFVWFLTGTPNPNDAADCWTIMRFCKATPLTAAPFIARYFRRHVGAFSVRHSPRPEMLPELHQAMRSFSIMRDLKDVGLDIPPIWLTTTSVDGDTHEIRALLAAYPDLERAVYAAVEAGGLSMLEADHIATLRRLVGEAKAPAYAEMLIEEFRGGKHKTVIMALHVRAMDIIEAALRKHGLPGVRIDGSVPAEKRGVLVQEFQEDPTVRWVLGNIKAAGTAITCTASDEIDMFEASWVPWDNQQALKRIHRIGQVRACRGRFISLANSIDETVTESNARKTAAIAKVEGAYGVPGTGSTPPPVVFGMTLTPEQFVF